MPDMMVPVEELFPILEALVNRKLYGNMDYPMCSDAEMTGVETALEEAIARACPDGMEYNDG